MLLVLYISTGCQEDKKNVEPPIIEQTVEVKKMDQVPINFERIVEMLPAKEYTHSYDSISQQYISWGSYTSKMDSTESAGIVLSSWNMGSSLPQKIWEYRDSSICDKSTASVSPELSEIQMVSIAGSQAQSPAIAYMMGCGGDGEKNKLYVLVLNAEGAEHAKFYGYPLSYNPSGGVDSLDLRYKSSLGKGKHAEGKIENYYDLDRYAPSDRKLIESLWRSALKHKLGIKETVPETPAQDSIKKS